MSRRGESRTAQEYNLAEPFGEFAELFQGGLELACIQQVHSLLKHGRNLLLLILQLDAFGQALQNGKVDHAGLVIEAESRPPGRYLIGRRELEPRRGHLDHVQIVVRMRCCAVALSTSSDRTGDHGEQRSNSFRLHGNILYNYSSCSVVNVTCLFPST